jgi:hypothetical protein
VVIDAEEARMPTVTWARVDPARRAAVIEAAEAEFGLHGFSNGSLNVIARRAGVAKGSLFQTSATAAAGIAGARQSVGEIC